MICCSLVQTYEKAMTILQKIGRKINEIESQESRVPDYGQVVQISRLFSIKEV